MGIRDKKPAVTKLQIFPSSDIVHILSVCKCAKDQARLYDIVYAIPKKHLNVK